MSSVIDFYESVVKTLNLDHGNINTVEQFDDRRFKFGVYLVNQDSRAVKIRKGNISELVIVDDLTDWFHHGHITFTNPDDLLERVQSQLLNEGADLDDTVVTVPYRFRGDARDMIYIHMEPHIAPDDQPSTSMNNIVHTFKFLFTVYAMEDILDERGKRYKKQKLYFHDYRLQMLREKTLYYSTAKNLNILGDRDTKQRSISQYNNTHREKTTGEIIQDILTASLLTTDTKNLFSKQWEFGSSKMFYTSPSENKAIDDLNYVLDKHVSSLESANQPCILKIQRLTERFELLPISKYFERATAERGPGVYQDEHFLLSFENEAINDNIPPERKTFGKNDRHIAINHHYPDISIIDDYIFSEINGVDCQEVLNSVITHRYNESDKEFGVDLSSGNISTIHNDFQSLFIKKTYGGEKGSGYTSWLTDSTREQNLNISITSSWSPDKINSLSMGRNKKLLAAFLLGNTIEFTSRGNSSRRSGVWIAIDRENNYIDSEYEEKVLGQYFVTRVTHRITESGEYENKIIGVKPYTYRNQRFSTNDILFKNPEQIEY